MSNTLRERPLHSSSTLDNTSLPRLSQDEPPPHTSIVPPNDLYRRNSPRPMGNTSSSTNTSDIRLRAPAQPRHHTQPLTDNRRRPPAADHSEDWLDHTGTGGSGRQNSFGYITGNLFETLDQDTPATANSPVTSDGVDINDFLSDISFEQEAENMPATRARRQNGGSFVDLTNDSSPPRSNTASSRQPRSLKRSAEAASQNRNGKRYKRSEDDDIKVEELDLTNEAPSAEEELLQAQQQQAIAAQQAAEESKGPLKIGKRQCIICMEPFTNATITHCGHIYCHECLTQALIAGEKNSERGIGNCPVCRKPVNRKKQNQMIVVSFMKKSAYKGKSKRDVG